MLTLQSGFLLVLGTSASVLAANVVKLPHISPSTVSTSQTLDPALLSFSIEPAFMTSFGGNNTNPNELTRRVMKLLEDRTGSGPDLRPGGATV